MKEKDMVLAVAMEGTPHVPCGMARLLIETDDDLVSILTPRGPAENGVTRKKFDDLANQGFATWLSRRKQGVEVQKDWYALYLQKELADALGSFNEALDLSLQPVDRQAESPRRLVLVPNSLEEMREKGWVIILGTSERLWRFRKEWAEKLRMLNHADNLRYLQTGKTDLSDDLQEKKELLDAIEERARFGLYCADPKITSVSYLNFTLELGLVMMRHRDPDTCYRIYKYNVERDFPRMSWDEFKKQITELQETHFVSFKDFQTPQFPERSSEKRPASDGKKELLVDKKAEKNRLWL
uniref:Uncharacterized protein n=1 Tax=Candidatus Kentrum sp. FM TaxID=2126340 RepID=A0A450RXZ1_9GAMM|nr:MAG: hypothetical protein BECKFM1743A_GA0114220_1000816 [Candidatus Kentron sp. FM]VFJ43867.1 MAG: hypothetical protein BECKFM1743C_GA0114222_1000418 [Candidatus Kentron sp. FM]VFK05758.1 MAG: hypothetical protein BECKFM1743B_GA0114221_1000413 [Candidatus Kentron sp. FM]